MKPGVYVHIPFCRIKCTYCDFPLTTRLQLAEDYYRALLAEIDMRKPTAVADTLYFGGGTPSLAPSSILTAIRGRLPLEDASEITLEANPDDMTPEALAGWKAAGINRLSIGVQSLEPAVLKSTLRRHTAEEAMQSLERARSAGFNSMNVDLMIGPPGQTVDGFFEGLDRLIAFRPQHFSVYLLELHEGTALYKQLQKGKVDILSEEDQVACYSGAVGALRSSGYHHYEVSNFALPGHLSRHNVKYWDGTPYYGYGAGACSFVDSARIENHPSVTAYIQAVTAGKLPVQSASAEDEETTMRNLVIFGMRRREGIDLHEFEQKYRQPLLSLFHGQAGEFLESGLMEISGSRLRLTLAGMLVSNDILSTVV